MAEDHKIEIPVLIKVNPDSKGTVNGVKGFVDNFGNLFKAIRSNPYILAAIALVVSAKKAIDAWRRQELAINSLNQAMINGGRYSRELSNQYQAMARVIEDKTKFADEEVIEATAALVPYMHGKQVSGEMMMRIADFATVQKMGLAEAASLVGKAIDTDHNTLERYGVHMESNAVGQERLIAVMAGLKNHWDGQAEAHIKGLGALDQMKNKLNDLLETVGRILTPWIGELAHSITLFANDLSKSERFLNLITDFMVGKDIAIEALKATASMAVQSMVSFFKGDLKILAALSKGEFNKLSSILDSTMDETKAIYLSNKKQFLSRMEEDMRIRAEYQSGHNERMFKALQATANKGGSDQKEYYSNLDKIVGARQAKELIQLITNERLKGNQDIKRLNIKIKHAKDATERHVLEAEKRKIIDKEIAQTQMDYAKKKDAIDEVKDNAYFKQTQNVIDMLANLKGSKYGPQVIIGKVAAIAAIILNTAISISNALVAFDEIPPPVGPALAQAYAAFTQIYAKEQIHNIIDSDIDHPGKIGEIPLTIGTLMKMIGEDLADQYAVVGQLWELTAKGAEKISAAVKSASEQLGFIGQALSVPFTMVVDIDALVAHAVAAIYGKIAQVVNDIAGAVADAVSSVVNAISNAISNVAHALFGWLFAAGGVVTHTASGSPSVIPLKQADLNLNTEINVKMRGGIVPSRQEAKRIARLINEELRK